MSADATAPRGLTVALQVGPAGEALRFYGELLCRPPDLSPAADVHEWQLTPRGWLLLATDVPEPTPTSTRVRFDVADLRETLERLRDNGFEVEPPRMQPGVIIFADLADPWGNPLGLYQDLAAG